MVAVSRTVPRLGACPEGRSRCSRFVRLVSRRSHVRTGKAASGASTRAEADSANDQRFAEPLPKHRAILSWDGFLLVDLSSTIS